MQKKTIIWAAAVSALLLLGCIFLFLPAERPAPAKQTVAYIPLDNRPVNQERVQYLAQAAGITLFMPEESLYRTALDAMPPNPDGSATGNREALTKWLLDMDARCDHFIISLDQMLSGGLVGSRWLSNGDLTQEFAIIDTVISLCENNTVYVFDTVMRLAPTVGYQGYTLAEYNALRAYGMLSRRELSGDALTVDNIIEAYSLSPDGSPIATELSAELLSQYLSARARKLRLIDYALEKAGDKLDFLYIGVDDSSPRATVQTNEIRYISAKMGDAGVLGAAADEMGLCCLARMITELYNTEVPLRVTYFGGGEALPADGFDIGTLKESMDNHLSALSLTPGQDSRALQVLCLTRGSGDAARNALLAQLKAFQAENIPTVLIDASEAPALLAEKMLADPIVDICRLLGYSGWNTAANAIGLALSNGVARYAYLSMGASSREANEGFLKALTFSYLKDISYKALHPELNGFLSFQHPCSPKKILARINSGKILAADFSPVSHGAVSVSDFRYPWNRTFEMCFAITIASNE